MKNVRGRHSVGTTRDADSKFSRTVHNNIQKSTFNRDQIIKTTFNAGLLIPCYIDEVLPGDTAVIDLAYISRMSTPIFPTMDNVELDFYFFFVPNRIVWDGWQKLNGENKDSAWAPATPPALVPTLAQSEALNGVPVGSIGDYYGLPVNVDLQFSNVTALPFRGYNFIWNRWFRDQNLQAPLVMDTSDDNISSENLGVLPSDFPIYVNKKHDYFSSCLPQPTKPIAVNVTATGLDRLPFFIKNSQSFGEDAWNSAASIAINVANGDRIASAGQTTTQGAARQNIIQVLRNAFQLNKLLERDARGGTRYIEMLKAHFNVEAEDYRLDYPEFLGMHHTNVGITQVPQTSSTDEVSPQGNLAAYSLTADQGHVFKKSFVEHGYIHGFVVARQRKTYQQGLERFWRRRDRFDFYYPELAHISEQPVLKSEILMQSALIENNRIFGFQEAFADYKYKPNRVCSQFRTLANNSLDAWHYADWYSSDFASSVVLSDAWIRDNSRINIDRTLAVNSSVQDQIIMDLKVCNKTTRPMPMYSIPELADHF